MVSNWLNDMQIHKNMKREGDNQANLQTKFKESLGATKVYDDKLKEMYKLYLKTGDDTYLYDQ